MWEHSRRSSAGLTPGEVCVLMQNFKKQREHKKQSHTCSRHQWRCQENFWRYKNVWFPQQNLSGTSCLCLLQHPSPGGSGDVFVVVNAPEQRISCCVLCLEGEDKLSSYVLNLFKTREPHDDSNLQTFVFWAFSQISIYHLYKNSRDAVNMTHSEWLDAAAVWLT